VDAATFKMEIENKKKQVTECSKSSL